MSLFNNFLPRHRLISMYHMLIQTAIMQCTRLLDLLRKMQLLLILQAQVSILIFFFSILHMATSNNTDQMND